MYIPVFEFNLVIYSSSTLRTEVSVIFWVYFIVTSKILGDEVSRASYMTLSLFSPSLSLSLSLPLSRNGCGWLATTCEPSFTLPVSLEYQWRIQSQSCTTSLADMPRLYASHRGKASPSWPIGMEKSVPTLAPYRRGQWPHCLKCSTTYSSSVVAIIRGALWFVSNHETQKQKIEKLMIYVLIQNIF